MSLEQKDGGRVSGYPVAANRTVPNGMKDFNRPVCDMLERNAHLCSVLNAPLPNSAVRMQSNRLPLANSHPYTPSVVERTGGSYLPQTAQQQCRTFNNGSQIWCGVYSTQQLTQAAAGGYCDSNISVRGCHPPVNGMLVSYAETRNGYCTNNTRPGITVGHLVPCRSYGPATHWSVAPATSLVNSEFVCKVNGVADVTAQRTNTNTSNLHFSAVMVSTVDSFLIV